MPAQGEEPADMRQKMFISPISGVCGCQMQQVSLQKHRFQNSGTFTVPQNFSSLIKSRNHQLYPENILIQAEFLYSVPLKVKFKWYWVRKSNVKNFWFCFVCGVRFLLLFSARLVFEAARFSLIKRWDFSNEAPLAHRSFQKNSRYWENLINCRIFFLSSCKTSWKQRQQALTLPLGSLPWFVLRQKPLEHSPISALHKLLLFLTLIN